MNNFWTDLPIGPNPPSRIYVIVEVPCGSSNKYEYDFEKGFFRLDRVLHSAVYYPGDYGLIPQTWSGDNEPLDILVSTTRPTFTGCVIVVRPIGVLKMEDEKGIDNKILGISLEDPIYDQVRNLKDVSKHFQAQISEFFISYKKLEPNKWVKLRGWNDAKAAQKMILAANQVYRKNIMKKT
jgi:inorganic pyrophosphatase